MWRLCYLLAFLPIDWYWSKTSNRNLLLFGYRLLLKLFYFKLQKIHKKIWIYFSNFGLKMSWFGGLCYGWWTSKHTKLRKLLNCIFGRFLCWPFWIQNGWHLVDTLPLDFLNLIACNSCKNRLQICKNLIKYVFFDNFTVCHFEFKMADMLK